MLSRRTFLGTLPAAALAPLARADAPRKKLAVVTTVWHERSHAWHMAERFLHGYPKGGAWHRPPFEVVSAYVDQYPDTDLAKGRAKEFGFTLYPSVADALRLGGNKLAVDAVLVIGEHGKYPQNEYGQTQYPRYEFFKQVAAVFEKDGAVRPVFNDKHLSWKWDWAKEMYDTARRMKIPFLAGSSLPVTWRMPSVEMPLGAEVEEAMCVAMGRVDSYDFHALEVIQCMVERRKGGETGVKAVQGLRGDAVWKAMDGGLWSKGLFEACLVRSQTLAQPKTFSHRFPTAAQVREWVRDPVAYRVEYADGLKATMLLMNGLVGDFTFAAKLKGKADPLSTLFYLPPVPSVTYSASLMSKAEELFATGVPPYPLERTLLTTGLVAAACESLGTGQKRLDTPHLAIKYDAPKDSGFLKD